MAEPQQPPYGAADRRAGVVPGEDQGAERELPRTRATGAGRFEDALLMECDEAQIRQALHELVDSLHNRTRTK